MGEVDTDWTRTTDASPDTRMRLDSLLMMFHMRIDAYWSPYSLSKTIKGI